MGRNFPLGPHITYPQRHTSAPRRKTAFATLEILYLAPLLIEFFVGASMHVRLNQLV